MGDERAGLLIPDIEPTLFLGRVLSGLSELLQSDAAAAYLAAILDEPGREFTFLLTAGALGWCTGGPDVMVDQIEHVLDVSQRDKARAVLERVAGEYRSPACVDRWPVGVSDVAE